jgi:hypothetical protein
VSARASSGDRLLVSASLFVGFAAAHLIDEFLFDAPAEFHLSETTAQILSLVFVAALAGLVALAGRGSRTSYLGLVIIGSVIAAADVAKHGAEMAQPGPWRSGVVSEFLAIGLVLSGSLTAVLAYGQWRRAGDAACDREQ